MKSFRVAAVAIGVSLLTGCLAPEEPELDAETEEAEETGEAQDEILNGGLAITRFKEVVRLDLDGVRCSGIMLNEEYIVTAAHCAVHLVELVPSLPYPFPPPVERRGPIDELVVTLAEDPEEGPVVAYQGPAKVMVHEFFNPNAGGVDLQDDIALIRTQGTMSPSFRARILETTSVAEEHHVTGWGNASVSTIQKRTGIMDFVSWTSEEGLKLERPEPGPDLKMVAGDSGGGAAIKRQNGSGVVIDLYTGVLANGGETLMLATRLPQKLYWIEGVASVHLGNKLEMSTFSTNPDQWWNRVDYKRADP